MNTINYNKCRKITRFILRMKTRPNIQIKLLNHLIRASYSALKQSIDTVFLLFFIFLSKFVQYVVKVVHTI